MEEEKPNGSTASLRVFLSYSRSEQARVGGLALLLEALGHTVFLDKASIKPGMRWEEKLHEGLKQADVLLVYWTKRAATSEWVRKEYEYFLAHFKDRLLVPILGDETPMSELLKPHQHSDFAPLINELIDLKRTMKGQGAKNKQIQGAIMERLTEAGVELDESQRKKVLRSFAPVGLLGLLAAPLLFLKILGGTGLEAAAHFTAPQVALVGAAAVSGAIGYGVVDSAMDPPSKTTPTEQVNGHLKLTGVFDAGGAPQRANWKVYTEPDALGDRKEITGLNNTADARFLLPVGHYFVRAYAGNASVSSAVVVAAGDTTVTELVLTPNPSD